MNTERKSVLVTGANGYIGKRLIPALISKGYQVVCSVRDKDRLHLPERILQSVQVIEVDFLQAETLHNIPKEIAGAYYLIHSMSASNDFTELERQSAINFRKALANTQVYHVIYLTGIVNEEHLSAHLLSRKAVEDELAKGAYHFTALRAGIIIGSGSASFEIIRDLVEKIPVMITPKWVNTRSQPIGIRDVLGFLEKSLFNVYTYDQHFDIAGPDILSYKKMMLEYAKVRKLKRYIFTIPFMTPRFSSYWLYFVTSTTYKLAIALVDSMKVEVVAKPNQLAEKLNIQPISYRFALEAAFANIKQNNILSSWKDSFISGEQYFEIADFVNVPEYGCFIDHRQKPVKDRNRSLQKIWSIGGKTGWYYATWLWKFRGYIDQMVGGVGLRRGRTSIDQINAGDAVDFWRVLYADREEGRLLLFAEMKLPGDAWLEFKLKNQTLYQTATFRPKGVWGRIYWYLVLPFHGLIFNRMLRRLAE